MWLLGFELRDGSPDSSNLGELEVQSLGFGVGVCGFAVLRFCGLRFAVWGLGFGVWGLGFGVWGWSFCRVQSISSPGVPDTIVAPNGPV